jgi:hypothetical protein
VKDRRLIALITKAQMDALLRLSKKKKVSLAEVVRLAIDAYMSGEQQQK